MGLFDIFKKKKKNTAPKPWVECEKLNDEQAKEVLETVKKISRKPAYRLTLDESREPAIFDTKFGGVPYWDFSREYPENALGEKLLLLAQINLSDVKDCEYLPPSGMLQFFIADDELYGMDFKSYISNDTFRVVYHKTIDKSVTADDVLARGIPTNISRAEENQDFLFPLDGETAVNVEKTEISVGTEDFMFERYLYKAAESIGLKLPEGENAFTLLPDTAFDEACNINAGHWLFGYAFFTQFDPRGDETQDYILLFQMDSDYANGRKTEIMWGDAGVGNFFIRIEDLRNLDFSKVLYTWDCG